MDLGNGAVLQQVVHSTELVKERERKDGKKVKKRKKARGKMKIERRRGRKRERKQERWKIKAEKGKRES